MACVVLVCACFVSLVCLSACSLVCSVLFMHVMFVAGMVCVRARVFCVTAVFILMCVLSCLCLFCCVF